MSAILAIQNTDGKKRVLPLILNSKQEVLQKYPLITGLAYKEYKNPKTIADEISRLTATQAKPADVIYITVEGVTGKLCYLSAPRRASVKWLAKIAQQGLEAEEVLRAGTFSEFYVRWVLVDVAAERAWQSMSRNKKRRIHAVVAAESEVTISYSEQDRLEDLSIQDGAVFHLYAIEDERFGLPRGAGPCDNQ